MSGGQALIQALAGLHHARDCPCVLAGNRRPVPAIIGHAVVVDLYNHSVHLFFLRLRISKMKSKQSGSRFVSSNGSLSVATNPITKYFRSELPAPRVRVPFAHVRIERQRLRLALSW